MKHSVQYKHWTCAANALYDANYEIEACKQVMTNLLSQSDCWIRPMGKSSDVKNFFYGFKYRGFNYKDMKPLIALCLQMTKPDSIIRVKLLLGLEAIWSGHFKNDIRSTLDAVLLINPSNFKYREADILLFVGLLEIDPLRSQNLLGYFLKETSELHQLFNTVSHAQFSVRKVLGSPILSPFIDESRTIEGTVVNIEKAKKKSVMEIRKNAFLLDQVMRQTKRIFRLPSCIVVLIIAMTADGRVQHADDIGKMAFNAEQEALRLKSPKLDQDDKLKQKNVGVASQWFQFF